MNAAHRLRKLAKRHDAVRDAKRRQLAERVKMRQLTDLKEALERR